MAVAGISPRDRAFPVRDEQDSRRVWSADPLFAKPTCALDGRNGSARPGVVEAAASPNASSSPFTTTGLMVLYSVGGVGQSMALGATIPALGYLAIDLGTYQYDQGVGIYDAAGNLVDALGVGAAPASGSSFHRCPNGRGQWVLFGGAPTKGAANNCP